MCSARINSKSLTHTHPLPSPVHTVCQKVLASTDLQRMISSFLPINDMHKLQNVCKATQRPAQLKSSVLDVREKALDCQFLKHLYQEHHPKALRVKLSKNWNDVELIERCKTLPSIVSLDLTECPDISYDGLIRASIVLAGLEEIHLKDDDKNPLSLDALRGIARVFNLKALHIKSEKGGLLYSVIQHSSDDEFDHVQEIPIKSIDMSAMSLSMSLADSFLKKRLSALSSLETLFLPKIYENEGLPHFISDEHILSLKKNEQLKNIVFSSELNDPAFDALGELIHLESISFLGDTHINDLRLSALKKLHLKKLHIDNAKELTETGLASIQHFPLVDLSLNHAAMNSTMIKTMEGFKHLGTLTLQHCTLNSRVVGCLGNFPRLKVLDLTGAKILGKLRLAHPLDKLVLKDAKLLFSLSSIDEVESAEIDISSSAEDTVCENLAPLNKTKIRKLTANHVLFSDRALASLTTLPDLKEATFGLLPPSIEAQYSLKKLQLQHLTLVHSRIDDPILKSISRISTLRTLSFKNVTHCNITENGFFQLKRLKNLTSVSSAQILDYFVFKKDFMKSLFSDEWFYSVFKNIACLHIKYPTDVCISSDDIDSRTTVTGLGDLTSSAERIQTFLVRNIRKQFRFKTKYKNHIESGRVRVAYPGSFDKFIPQFEPTIIQAWHQTGRFRTLYMQGKGPQLDNCPAVPMTLVDDDKWQAILNTPVESYKLFENEKPENRGFREIDDWGFGLTHDAHPVFIDSKPISPFFVIQAICYIPKGHTLYLGRPNSTQRIPMVPIGRSLWEVRVTNLLQYKFYLDNIHEEIGDPHSIRSPTNVSSPQFKDNLHLGPVPALTTIIVDYIAPAGHTVFLRKGKESIPMVPKTDSLWETCFAAPPGPLEVTLDNIVAAEKSFFTPKSGKITRIKPTFAFDKVLQR